MSEPVNPRASTPFDGVVRITDAGPLGMVTIRADLADAGVRNALAGCLMCGIPEPLRCVVSDADRLLWMAPDELLLVCPHDEVQARLAALSQAFAGLHHLVVDVSDARAAFRVEGEGRAIRETLAKLTPADMRPSAFPVGMVRRTRLAQVPAAFWFDSEGAAHLICFRSVADYTFGILKHAAAPGSEVGYFG